MCRGLCTSDPSASGGPPAAERCCTGRCLGQIKLLQGTMDALPVRTSTLSKLKSTYDSTSAFPFTQMRAHQSPELLVAKSRQYQNAFLMLAIAMMSLPWHTTRIGICLPHSTASLVCRSADIGSRRVDACTRSAASTATPRTQRCRQRPRRSGAPTHYNTPRPQTLHPSATG